ncbi:MAG: glycosyltransferase [Betaproteobacteria bacterium]|nr:MAG: glycosyltransferase [Betaproteobacteria bacterium]
MSQLVLPTTLLAGQKGSRNSQCECGSGLRYKVCCGAIDGVLAPAILLESSKRAGLAAQLRSEFAESVGCYETALRLEPLDFDVAHMRAVALYQMGCMSESLDGFFQMLAAGHTMTRDAWHNFGLSLSSAVHLADDPVLLKKVAEYQRWNAERQISHPDESPTVTVVLASYNHEKYIVEAIRSVLQQTRLPDELVVIDDGSTDGSPALIRQALIDAPFPTTLIFRENRGAANTFNEAIGLSKSQWIAPLNSDDRFAPDRIEHMFNACCRKGIDWSFGRINVLDAQGTEASYEPNTRAHSLRGISSAGYLTPTAGMSFLLSNPAISTGNLFFRKTLWERLGGFRDWRYNHDWHFALEACLYAEPLRVASAVYEYRMHESNTISENRQAATDECTLMMRDVLLRYASFKPDESGNPFAPCPAVWRRAFYSTVGGAGFLEQFPETALNLFAKNLLEAAPAC